MENINILPPPNSGSFYFNYKHDFSVVLMALVNAEYRFLFVEVGCNGRISDGGVFTASALYRALESNLLQIPDTNTLPGRNIPVPYTIVADDAFPLKSYLMKPFPRNELLDISKRIFNYR